MISTRLAIPVLGAVLAGATVAGLQGAAWPSWAGAALAAGAPLAFILIRAGAETALTEHPLIISIGSGLGCVSVMIGQQRFGPDQGWILPGAVAALIVWMLWQRGQRDRATASRR